MLLVNAMARARGVSMKLGRAGRQILGAVVILGGAIGVAGCATTQSSGLYGVPVSGSNIVFLLDVSPSMAGLEEEVIWRRHATGVVDDAARASARKINEVASGVGTSLYNVFNDEVRQQLTKLAGAKRELGPTIEKLSPSAQFTVLTFSSRITPWNEALVPANDANKGSAKYFVQSATTSSDTYIGAALSAAFAIEGVDEIFLITDGEPTDKSPSAILEEVNVLNPERKVRINAIGLGQDQDEDFLRTLVAHHNGRFTQKLN